MGVLDEQGRLWGRVSILDLAAVLGAAAVALGAYLLVVRGGNVMPANLDADARQWVELECWLPPEEAWLIGAVGPGSTQYEARSGRPIARVLGPVDLDGQGGVRVAVHAVPQANGAWVWRRLPLVPGQPVVFRTDEGVLETKLYRVAGPMAAAP